ncbi:NitT/TauT family transport system ATP-binding protein [Corticibacter populi]|nr:NitT/TauT family transport system ATP-binding protein [Corticibacter populi]
MSAGESLNWALSDVDLDIAAGEFVCAIGPSGCGKTTLLNMIAGFIRPTKGQLYARGQAITGPGPDRGVVFQEYALFPWLTAQKNIEFGLKQQGVAKAQRQAYATELLRLTGLLHAGQRYPFELSGGMRQRVAVARALATRPGILLMDEPFAAIDALTRATLQEELLRIWQELGLSVFFITHNIDEAVFLAQRIVVMSPHPGRVRDIIDIPLPYPRRRDDPAFGAIYARIAQSFEKPVEPEKERLAA